LTFWGKGLHRSIKSLGKVTTQFGTCSEGEKTYWIHAIESPPKEESRAQLIEQNKKVKTRSRKCTV